MSFFLVLALFFFILPLQGNEKKIRALYNSLDQTSAQQHLSFYELFPDTNEGKKALQMAKQLLSGNQAIVLNLKLDRELIEGLISLINKQPNQQSPELSEIQLELIEALAKQLSNRHLKGFQSRSEREILSLNADEIDLARAVLISQMGEDGSFQKIRSYEASLDLMALQILAKLRAKDAVNDPEKKIQTINTFIFEEMGFRFPPHSKYAEAIDLYTFLPSVLDSRHGVCLGVSILYLSLAQRLGLNLEVITPPGHIYIRYKNETKEINIETTARGVHIASEEYLGIETKKLRPRTIKEVVGLAHINNASIYLREEKYAEALKCYEKAELYLPEDKLLQEFKGFCYLLMDETEKAHHILRKKINAVSDDDESMGTALEDYFAGNADKEAIRTLFLHTDEKRLSILKKKDALEKVVKNHPKFREGWQSLAICWLKLHRTKEALNAFEQYHLLDPGDPTVEYYLAVIHENRYNYPKAWEHLRLAEKITSSVNHYPKALKYLRRKLDNRSPEP